MKECMVMMMSMVGIGMIMLWILIEIPEERDERR
jgi:hypothetical protein